MQAYNIGMCEKLILAAETVLKDSDGNFDAAQTASYLSLLSCEIALKALLERAGVPTEDIRRRSHDLSLLLKDLGTCEVPVTVTAERTHWGRATGIRAKSVQAGTSGTVGQVLDGGSAGASKYPNEIRYGTKYSHFSPEALLQTAKQVLAWAQEYWDTIRLPKADDAPN